MSDTLNQAKKNIEQRLQAMQDQLDIESTDWEWMIQLFTIVIVRNYLI